MLTGEVGAGKHNLTQLYHALCGRTGEFVRLDCSTLVEVRQTSVLLFGHDAGALREDEYMNLRIRHILNHAKGLNDAVREFVKSKLPLYS